MPALLASIAIVLDVALWVMMVLLGQIGIGAISHPELSRKMMTVLLDIWNFLHAPVTALLTPYLMGLTPSHGGGVAAVIAETVYVAACLIWLGMVVFFLTMACEYLRHRFSDRKEG